MISVANSFTKTNLNLPSGMFGLLRCYWLFFYFKPKEHIGDIWGNFLNIKIDMRGYRAHPKTQFSANQLKSHNYFPYQKID